MRWGSIAPRSVTSLRSAGRPCRSSRPTRRAAKNSEARGGSCIDETHITRKSRNRGGFQGRTTLGHQTIVMAGVELDGPWAGRKQTGKAFCVIVTDHAALTFKQVIGAFSLEFKCVWYMCKIPRGGGGGGQVSESRTRPVHWPILESCSGDFNIDISMM